MVTVQRNMASQPPQKNGALCSTSAPFAPRGVPDPGRHR